ncbi:hypothetical protein JW859_11235 [bacterium]|nr:hypothetical protein [bacterium]
MDSSRLCPHCGVLLEYRLGRYECPQCDYAVFEQRPPTQTPAAPAQRPGGFQPPAAPAGYTLSALSDPRQRVINPRAIHDRTATLGADKIDPGQLLLEKLVAYGILAVSVVLLLLIFIPVMQRFAFEYGWLGGGGVIAALLLGLAVWLWGLFGSAQRIKIACLLIAIASSLATFIFCVWALYYHLKDEIQYIQQLPFKGDIFLEMDYLYMTEINGWFWAAQVFIIMLNVWLFFIMLRDLRYQQATAPREDAARERAW